MNMIKKTSVSIIINNYNYGRFLKNAIESVLNQTYKPIDLIVVDDGSTDNSHEIIAKYDNEITAILKENGGQGSAYNAGFFVARGEIIIFLDSDDMLLENTVQRVVEAFQSDPKVVKVQYRLQVIKENGELLDRTYPRVHQKMPTGDLRPGIFEFPNYLWPPASGNAFSVKALHSILPMPESAYRLGADIYVNYFMPFLGSITSLDEPGALYRRHSKNATALPKEKSIDVSAFRKSVVRINSLHSKCVEIIGDKGAGFKKRDSKYLIARMVSIKLEPDKHPFEDSVITICINGIITALSEPQTKNHQKIFLAFWFVAMACSPNSFASSLTTALIHPHNRHPLLRKVIGWIRGMQKTPA